MPSWKGNIDNPAPNNTQEPIDRSEKFVGDNRAQQVRRDTDTQKSFTISLQDIDDTIALHLEQMQLQVQDVGQQVKVPIYYSSPEKWVSAQRDGYLRDKQGKIILPAMVFKRTNSENDTSLQYFNRYLDTPAMKLYSSKNKYTRFGVLAGQNAPVNEVYNMVFPSHMLLTYKFIVWTEYVEQMNALVERLQFETKDYWGSKKGFRFRTRIETFGHSIELQTDDDRIVKTEFDLITHGYILPDMLNRLERHQMTTQKMFTPKKFIVGAEVVMTSFDLEKKDPNREKWRNPNYPNLQIDVPIPEPPVTVLDGADNLNFAAHIITALRYATAAPRIEVTNTPVDATSFYLRVVPVPGVSTGSLDAVVTFPFLRLVPFPSTQAALGQDGNVTFNDRYFYIHSEGIWKRVAISEYIPNFNCDGQASIGQEGNISFDDKYFYIYTSGRWQKVAMSEFTPVDGLQGYFPDNSEVNVSFDDKYFYIYTSEGWQRVAISQFS